MALIDWQINLETDWLIELLGYGQTECAAVATVQMIGERACGQVGPPSPCVKIKLVDVPEMDYFARQNKGSDSVSFMNFITHPCGFFSTEPTSSSTHSSSYFPLPLLLPLLLLTITIRFSPSSQAKFASKARPSLADITKIPRKRRRLSMRRVGFTPAISDHGHPRVSWSLMHFLSPTE